MPGLHGRHVSSMDIGSGFLQYGSIGQQETLLNDYHLGSSSLLGVPEVRECTLLSWRRAKLKGLSGAWRPKTSALGTQHSKTALVILLLAVIFALFPNNNDNNNRNNNIIGH